MYNTTFTKSLACSEAVKYKSDKGISLDKWLANSTHNLKIVGLNLVSSNILDGNGVKAMSGSIPEKYR